jgi:heme-degrading monooxygenase HmoA
MSRLRISAEQSDALVGACRARVHLVDHADGFVELQVWRTTGSRPSSIKLERLEHLHTYEVVAE